MTAVQRFQERVVEMLEQGNTGWHITTNDAWHTLSIEKKCEAILQMWDAPRIGTGRPVDTGRPQVNVRELVGVL